MLLILSEQELIELQRIILDEDVVMSGTVVAVGKVISEDELEKSIKIRIGETMALKEAGLE